MTLLLTTLKKKQETLNQPNQSIINSRIHLHKQVPKGRSCDLPFRKEGIVHISTPIIPI